MKQFIITALILSPLLLNGQVNYVPNPGFEEKYYCPGGFSAFSWYNETSVKYWMNGSAGTSDYYNACAGDGAAVGVPSNTLALDQPAHSGDGYVGFYAVMWDWGTWLYREYVQVELTTPLTAGTCYYVEFWCAPSNPQPEYASGYATSDAIGAYFSEIKIGNPMISDVLPLTPQIDNNGTGNIIDPPGGWTKVAGMFEAAGDEAWVAFGNFYHDDFVEVYAFTGGELTDQPVVYYFMDDVLITPIDSFMVNSFPDTVICSPWLLEAPAGADSYLWNTGDTTSSILITASGYYSITFETQCGTYVYDANVLYAEDSINSTSTSIEICSSELPYTLEAFPAYDTYLWYDGSTSQTTVINDEGIYYVTGTSECAVFIDTFIIMITDPVGVYPDLGNDTLICEESWSLTLSSPPGFTTYGWNTGDSTLSIDVFEEGIYVIEVESACELYIDSIVITEDPYLNATIDLGDDFELCPPIGIEQYTIYAGTELPNYLWSTGETTSEITVTTPGTYWLRSDLLCSTPSDTVEITICNDIAVPNAFSPNGDGVNDELVVFILNPGAIVTFQIFNRWGELVYDGDENNYRWDGTFENKQQPIANYVYVLRYFDEGIEKMMQGNILLVR